MERVMAVGGWKHYFYGWLSRSFPRASNTHAHTHIHTHTHRAGCVLLLSCNTHTHTSRARVGSSSCAGIQYQSRLKLNGCQ